LLPNAENLTITVKQFTFSSNQILKTDLLELRAEEILCAGEAKHEIEYVKIKAIKSIDEAIGKVLSTKKLEITQTHLKFHDSLKCLTDLEYLRLYSDYSFDVVDKFLLALPDDFSCFPKLKTLRITGAMVKSIDFVATLPQLEGLQFTFFPAITALPEALAKCNHLKKLSITNMVALKDIQVLEKLPQLTHLDLSYLNSVPPEQFEVLGSLRNLRFLQISHCDRLVEYPPSISDLTSLETLYFHYLPFRELPDSISMLVNIQHLYLKDLSYLRTLPEALVKIPLKKLTLGHTTLVELSDVFKQWRLEELRLWFSKFSGHNMKREVYGKLIGVGTKVWYKDSTYGDLLFDEVV
jgi:Leucine-rich repeat (LRR) protein